MAFVPRICLNLRCRPPWSRVTCCILTSVCEHSLNNRKERKRRWTWRTELDDSYFHYRCFYTLMHMLVCIPLQVSTSGADNVNLIHWFIHWPTCRSILHSLDTFRCRHMATYRPTTKKGISFDLQISFWQRFFDLCLHYLRSFVYNSHQIAWVLIQLKAWKLLKNALHFPFLLEHEADSD